MPIPKPEPRGPKPPSRIRPRCVCGQAERKHELLRSLRTDSAGLDQYRGRCVASDCPGYSPALRPRAKPRCKACGHPHSKHADSIGINYLPGCYRCLSCPGYSPARRGSKASRRAPLVALRKQAKELWSKCVRARPGGCECPRAEHAGFFQGAHGWTKKSYPGVRYDLRNGWKLTNDCHRYFTDHPIEWDDFMRASLGPEEYDRLRRDAVANVTVDLEAKVIELRAELARLGEMA